MEYKTFSPTNHKKKNSNQQIQRKVRGVYAYRNEDPYAPIPTKSYQNTVWPNKGNSNREIQWMLMKMMNKPIRSSKMNTKSSRD